MCIAIPGKIIKIDDNHALIQYHDQTRQAKIVTDEYHVGDYVIAQAGLVIEKIPKKQMDTWQEFLEAS